jgi:hypothetical protein
MLSFFLRTFNIFVKAVLKVGILTADKSAERWLSAILPPVFVCSVLRYPLSCIRLSAFPHLAILPLVPPAVSNPASS